MSKNCIKQENPLQNNPWDVPNIQEFLFYNCPECDIRLKDGEKFVQHALNNHELSKFFLNKPIEEILSPNCEEILHQEREENRKECPPPMESPVHFQDDEDLLIPAVKTELDPLTPVEVCRCNICSMPFQTTFELEQHVKQFHQMQKKLHEIQCTYCSQSYPTTKEFNSHLKEFHSSVLQPEKDTESLTEESGDQPEEKSEKMEKENPNCQEEIVYNVFEDKSEPVTKRQKRTQNVGTKVQKCPHCNFETDHPSAFKKHTDSFKICSECNEIFCGKRSTQNLKSHLKTHRPKKVFVCEICNKSFKFASALKTHVIRSSCGSAVVHSPIQDKYVLYRTLFE